MNNKNKKYAMNYKIGRVGEIISPSYPKIDLINTFNNFNFANIIFLCCEKGYVYRTELAKVLCIEPRYYLNKLVHIGILERFDLNDRELGKLVLINNLNKLNISMLKTYRLKDNVKVTLQNPLVYELLCDSADVDLKKYVGYLNDRYNDKLEEIRLKEQEQEQTFLLKYNIAKQKKESLKTAEDWAIINMVENLITRK